MGNSNVCPKDMEKKFIIECIDLYRKLPALWKVSSTLYQDQHKKNKAYDILLAKCKIKFPQATLKDVKEKIIRLRTNYRNELKEHMSMTSGGGNGSRFVPKLWCYKEMSFLKYYELKASVPNKRVDNKNSKTGGDARKQNKQETQNKISTNGNQVSTVNEASTHRTAQQNPKYDSKNTSESKNDKLVNLAYNCLTEVKDDYHHWGMVCAADLRKMERTQQLYAKKAIAEILVEGQLGLLHRNCVKITQQNSFNSTMAQLDQSPLRVKFGKK